MESQLRLLCNGEKNLISLGEAAGEMIEIESGRRAHENGNWAEESSPHRPEIRAQARLGMLF